MPLRFFKAIKEGRTCSDPTDNCLTLTTKPTSFLRKPPHFNMSTFNSASFITATIYLCLRNLLREEEHIITLIDLCQNDPTLALNLQLILESVANKKRLEEIAGYTKPIFSMYNITITAIAAAIRNLGNLPLIPNATPTCFAGRGIVNYFHYYDLTIHTYGKARAHHVKQQPRPHRQPVHRCSKCKGPGHIRRNCGAYQCAGCQEWGPGHTAPNCPISHKEARETWERTEEWAKAMEEWGMNNKTHWERWANAIKTWEGVPDIPNEAWRTPTASAPPPSPLTDHLDLVSEFSSSSSDSSLLFIMD